MNRLETNWIQVSIGKVAAIATGKLDANAAIIGGQYPFFTCADESLQIDTYAFNTEAILLAGNGGFGIKWFSGKFNAYQRTYVIEPVGVYGKYLYYCIKNSISEITSNNRGSTIKYLRLGDISETRILIPPFNEQKRIADKLDQLLAAVDSCKARLSAIPEIIDRFRKSVLAAATSGELTADWREEMGVPFEWDDVVLEKIASDFSYGTSAKSAKNGKVPVLRMGNIQGGRLVWDDLVYTSDTNEIEKYKLRTGDVLFNRTNSPELVGKTAVYKAEQRAIFAGYLIRVRCSEKLIPDFLNYCLNSPSGRDYCWQVKTDGVSQSNINAKKLAALPVSLPPVEEQYEIVRRVEALFSVADRLEVRLETAIGQVEQLTSSILAKAFRGELVPQDPNDEPADKLLERIRAQREATPTVKPARKARTANKTVTDTAPPKPNRVKPAPSKVASTSVDDIVLTKTARKILRHMKKNISYAKWEIITPLVLSTGEWNSAINELKNSGLVVQTGDKRGATYSKKS